MAGVSPRMIDVFAEGYPFAVAPAVDARPYPGHFLRPGSVVRLSRGDLGAWLPFAEWGPIALFATLVQSAAVAAALMLLPLALARAGPARVRGEPAGAEPGVGRGPTGDAVEPARAGARPAPAPVGPPARRTAMITYFGAIGLGYMAAEIAAIPPLSLLLGHPVYAVSAVLALLLVSSGAGSAWSDRLESARAQRVAWALAVALAVYALLILPLAHAAAGAALPQRAAAALAVLAPAGFLMGMPFALGLRSFCGRGESPALAWAANGFASVVAVPLAALVALEAGTRALLLVAAAGYAAAALVHGAARAAAPAFGTGGRRQDAAPVDALAPTC
jgi:hypothetical protein